MYVSVPFILRDSFSLSDSKFHTINFKQKAHKFNQVMGGRTSTETHFLLSIYQTFSRVRMLSDADA